MKIVEQFQGKIPRSTLKRILKNLRLAGKITLSPSNKNTMFKVVDYDKYQNDRTSKNTPDTPDTISGNRVIADKTDIKRTSDSEKTDIKRTSKNTPDTPDTIETDRLIRNFFNEDGTSKGAKTDTTNNLLKEKKKKDFFTKQADEKNISLHGEKYLEQEKDAKKPKDHQQLTASLVQYFADEYYKTRAMQFPINHERNNKAVNIIIEYVIQHFQDNNDPIQNNDELFTAIRRFFDDALALEDPYYWWKINLVYISDNIPKLLLAIHKMKKSKPQTLVSDAI
ncbi:MAG: hypothetical protein K9I71_11145 [Ignavibacteriales bacterium]|nr:hypothetical protein [Ignavibacteriales bacterium]MCF8316676.1 hypothetical protein [Ignavibacteriales bacterium]